MRAWIALAAGGCFSPSPLRGQTCTSWCPPPEQCIAGQCVAGAGSGSDVMPVDANYIFVTSTTKAPRDIGGLEGADAWCNELAGVAQLPGQYLAWLSTYSTDAVDRLRVKNARGWYRVDGKPFADTISALVSDAMYYPPRLTEHGDDLGATAEDVVGTGTQSDGRNDFVGATCGDWASDVDTMLSGAADGGREDWTYATYTQCTQPVHIYCFGIDKTVAVPPPALPVGTRLAFVAPVTLGGGTPALDTACQQAATAAGITGTFFAWLSTTGASAQSKLSGTTPWRRKDNVVALTPPLELDAPIDVTLDDKVPSFVWTGAPLPQATSPTPAASCGDWTVAASTSSGQAGDPHRSVVSQAFGGATQPCNSLIHVTCLER